MIHIPRFGVDGKPVLVNGIQVEDYCTALGRISVCSPECTARLQEDGIRMRLAEIFHRAGKPIEIRYTCIVCAKILDPKT
jgi:hypothetical protein